MKNPIRIFVAVAILVAAFLSIGCRECDPGGILSPIKEQKGLLHNGKNIPLAYIAINGTKYYNWASGESRGSPQQFFGGTEITYEAAGIAPSTYHVGPKKLTIDGDKNGPTNADGYQYDWGVVIGGSNYP